MKAERRRGDPFGICRLRPSVRPSHLPSREVHLSDSGLFGCASLFYNRFGFLELSTSGDSHDCNIPSPARNHEFVMTRRTVLSSICKTHSNLPSELGTRFLYKTGDFCSGNEGILKASLPPGYFQDTLRINNIAQYTCHGFACCT